MGRGSAVRRAAGISVGHGTRPAPWSRSVPDGAPPRDPSSSTSTTPGISSVVSTTDVPSSELSAA